MKVYTVFDSSYCWVYSQYFLPSLPMDAVLEPYELCNVDYYTIIKTRNEKILESLYDAEDNEVICWSDVDVQFFTDNIGFLKQYIEDYDAVYQSDSLTQKVACAGFCLLKNTVRIRGLYRSILSSISLRKDFDLVDQPLLNEMLNKLNIKWNVFPDNVVWTTRNKDGRCYNPVGKVDIPLDIKIHHANWIHKRDKQHRKAILDLVRDTIKNSLDKE